MFAQALFAATMLLCSMLIAGSEPVAPVLWVLFGIATVARPKLSELHPADAWTMLHAHANTGRPTAASTKLQPRYLQSRTPPLNDCLEGSPTE